MSRRNKHNRNRNQNQPVDPSSPDIQDNDDMLAESLGADEDEQDTGSDESETQESEAEVSQEEQIPEENSPEPTQPVVPELNSHEEPELKPDEIKKPEVKVTHTATEAVDLDNAPKPSMPIIRFGKPKKVNDETVIRTKAVKEIVNSVSKDPKMHTASGRQLIKMFDEYDALCKASRPDDGNAHAICARKLYDIMVMCCPRGGHNSNAPYMNELIGIVFSRMLNGYGTKFKESTLLKADYRLPTPTDSMKFDAFYSCMYQLVEAAKTGQRIRFNNIALSKVLQSPAAMTVITKIRRRLESARQ